MRARAAIVAWREVAVALAAPGDLAEQRLHPPLPRHPRELVDCRDHQRRQQPVDLLIDDHDWQPFARAVARRERALARDVRARRECPAAIAIRLDVRAAAQR